MDNIPHDQPDNQSNDYANDYFFIHVCVRSLSYLALKEFQSKKARELIIIGY